MTEKTCQWCAARHYGPIAGTKQSAFQCRRRPPQIVVVPKAGPVLSGNVQLDVNAWWPVVSVDDFCLDWIDKQAGAFVGAPDAGLMS